MHVELNDVGSELLDFCIRTKRLLMDEGRKLGERVILLLKDDVF
jgi:hypothetical protein